MNMFCVQLDMSTFGFCRYLVGGYLSAETVVNMFSKAVMETANWPSISSTLDCQVRPVLGGPELRLEIRCVWGGMGVCVCARACVNAVQWTGGTVYLLNRKYFIFELI